MQPYKSRVAESREAMVKNNETPGAKEIVYFEKKGGFKFSRNGAEFTEVILVVKDKKTGVVSEKELIMGELVRPDGTRTWETQSMNNWNAVAHNADAILGCVKHFKEGQKARTEAKAASCLEYVAKAKGFGLSHTAIRAAAIADGFNAEIVDAALKAKVEAEVK